MARKLIEITVGEFAFVFGAAVFRFLKDQIKGSVLTNFDEMLSCSYRHQTQYKLIKYYADSECTALLHTSNMPAWRVCLKLGVT